MRLRRSASQMKHDPYTLYIFENTNGYASGSIYEDERDGYEIEIVLLILDLIMKRVCLLI